MLNIQARYGEILIGQNWVLRRDGSALQALTSQHAAATPTANLLPHGRGRHTPVQPGGLYRAPQAPFMTQACTALRLKYD